MSTNTTAKITYTKTDDETYTARCGGESFTIAKAWSRSLGECWQVFGIKDGNWNVQAKTRDAAARKALNILNAVR